MDLEKSEVRYLVRAGADWMLCGAETKLLREGVTRYHTLLLGPLETEVLCAPRSQPFVRLEEEVAHYMPTLEGITLAFWISTDGDVVVRQTTRTHYLRNEVISNLPPHMVFEKNEKTRLFQPEQSIVRIELKPSGVIAAWQEFATLAEVPGLLG